MNDLQSTPPLPIKNKKSGFIERNLAEFSHLLEQSIFAEGLSHEAGLLQPLDPRVKIVSLLAVLIAVGFSRSLWVIVLLYAIVLILAGLSKIPLKLFITRVWLFMPFFTGIIALPALFITPGPILLHLPLGIVITRTGALSALFLILRVGTSVSLSILTILTTPWNSLLKALRVLYIPDVIVLILGMTYRYIYLLLITASDMFLSRKSRIVGRLSGSEERQVVAATAGVLLSRSLQMSSEVYLAMQSRGFYRTPKTMDTFKMKTADWIFGWSTLAVAALSIYIGH